MILLLEISRHPAAIDHRALSLKIPAKAVAVVAVEGRKTGRRKLVCRADSLGSRSTSGGLSAGGRPAA